MPSYHRPLPKNNPPDEPALTIDPRNLFTLPYVQLIEAISLRLFPPNATISGTPNPLDSRIDRYILFKATWIPKFGVDLQIALRDFAASVRTRESSHFAPLADDKKDALLHALEDGSFSNSEWSVLRSQSAAFKTIFDAICEGFFSEPGYGGNYLGQGWAYSNFIPARRK